MKISEIFYSIQGEGMYTGHPSLFIRSYGCNYKCTYCDTPYAVVGGKFADMSVKQILKEVDDNNKDNDFNHIVITGGEPMIQSDIAELVDMLKSNGYIVTIETNGTIFNNDVKPNLWSISPKTLNSTNDKFTSFKSEEALSNYKDINNMFNIMYFINTSGNIQIKFVINDDDDLIEIKKFINKYNIAKKYIYLMPQGKDIREQKNNSLNVINICKKEGYIFCPRLHIYLWGSKRGV